MKVISPDLIREVEARMNRNYLPPSLKQSQISGSPPSNSYVMPQQKRFGRTCKLPTVQEVMGKSANLRFVLFRVEIWFWKILILKRFVNLRAMVIES